MCSIQQQCIFFSLGKSKKVQTKISIEKQKKITKRGQTGNILVMFFVKINKNKTIAAQKMEGKKRKTE